VTASLMGILAVDHEVRSAASICLARVTSTCHSPHRHIFEIDFSLAKSVRQKNSDIPSADQAD